MRAKEVQNAAENNTQKGNPGPGEPRAKNNTKRPTAFLAASRRRPFLVKYEWASDETSTNICGVVKVIFNPNEVIGNYAILYSVRKSKEK